MIDLLHGFEVLSTTEETLFNSRNVSRLVQNNQTSFPRFRAYCIIIKNNTCICLLAPNPAFEPIVCNINFYIQE